MKNIKKKYIFISIHFYLYACDETFLKVQWYE